MKLELASATLRRERATAMRRSLNILVERFTPLVPSGIRLVKLCQTAGNPGFTQIQRSPS